MKDIDTKLTKAINTLAEYAEKNLQHGFEITLYFSRDECSLDLTDADGESVEVHGDGSPFRDACDVATEIVLREIPV